MPQSTKLSRRAAWTILVISSAVLCGMTVPQGSREADGHRIRIGPDSLFMDSSYVEESCAPNDGPAVTLFFGGRVMPIAAGEGVQPPYVTVSIWRGWSTLAGHTFLLHADAGGAGGFASYCARDRKCERLDFARVSFDAVTQTRVRGSADLTLQEHAKGDSVSTYQASIPFNARRLAVKMICG